MNLINLQCPAEEWYLARIYTNIGKDDISTETFKEAYKKKFTTPVYFITIIFSLMILLSILSSKVSFISKHNSRLLVLIGLLLIVGIVWMFREFREYKKEVSDLINHPSLDNEVTLYSVTKEAILINYFNNEEYKFILPYENIQFVSVKEMTIEPIWNEQKNTKESIEESLKKEFEQVKEEIPDFPYDELLKHEDKHSVNIKTKQGGNILLPIPPTWERSGLADKFIKFLQDEIVDVFLNGGKKEDLDLVDSFFPKFYQNDTRK